MEEYDAYTLLKRSGARLPIDNIEFIDPILDLEQSFRRTFYLAGARYYVGCEEDTCENTIEVVRGDKVNLVPELGNKEDKNVIAVYQTESQKIGYIPRYYYEGILNLINTGREVQCFINAVDKNKNCQECIKLELVVK